MSTEAAMSKHHRELANGHTAQEIERSTLALLGRIDIQQTATVATRKLAAGTVVDGAFAPDGRFYFVVRDIMKGNRRVLYEFDNFPLPPRIPTAIATGKFIAIRGVDDTGNVTFTKDSQASIRTTEEPFGPNPIFPNNREPVYREDRHFTYGLETIKMPGGQKPWRLSLQDEARRWCWKGDRISALRALCVLPESGHTCLLVDPNTKHSGADLELVVLDMDGQCVDGLHERMEGATGRMRRLGNVIVIEGADKHGPNVRFYKNPGYNEILWREPLVGKFERLTALDGGLIAGWHFADGVLSIVHYDTTKAT